MATERLSMTKTREILRQKWVLGRTHRQTAASLGASAGAVGSVLARAKAAGLATWEQIEALDDDALERTLYGAAIVDPSAERHAPDCAWIHRERHRPGVTLELLHLEYLRQHPGGYRYTAFCDRYRAWLGQRGLVMRQVHVAGDKMFVDYSGKKPSIVDARHRRGARSRALRRGDGRLELHVRRGDAQPAGPGSATRAPPPPRAA